MAIYFNDLTLDKIPQQNMMLLREFWPVMKRLSQATEGLEKRAFINKTGFNMIHEALASNPEQGMFLGSFFASPYVDEDAQERMMASENHGAENEYWLQTDSGDRLECPMMGWAQANRSLTVGLSLSSRWNQLVYLLEKTSIRDDGEFETFEVEAVCVTKCEQIENPRVRGWIAAQRDFERVPDPAPCGLNPKLKHIKIQMHHGIDVLTEFAERLCRVEYVQGVVDTIPWDSKGREFIVECHDDGTVDIRLHWTSRGYGMKIQTTARGLLQTRKAAEMLKAKFDRKS